MSAVGVRPAGAGCRADSSGADHGTPCAVPPDLLYEAVYAECIPTAAEVEREVYGRIAAAQVEREVYGRIDYRGYTVPANKRKRRTVAQRKRARLAKLSETDRTLLRILGGVPRPRAPRKAAA